MYQDLDERIKAAEYSVRRDGRSACTHAQGRNRRRQRRRARVEARRYVMTGCRECRHETGHTMDCSTGQSGTCVLCTRRGSHHDDVADHWFCEDHAGPLAWSDSEVFRSGFTRDLYRAGGMWW